MKRISITVSLNRSTVQMDEASFVRLESYLGEASRTLSLNPDRQEILADLEQAIADRCLQRLPAGQTVISLMELETVLTEVGEVRDTASEPADRRPSTFRVIPSHLGSDSSNSTKALFSRVSVRASPVISKLMSSGYASSWSS